MKEEVLAVKNQMGIHAKPAALFVQTAARFKSAVTVSKDGVQINGKSIMGLMLLAAECGSKLKVTVDGPDEAAALAALKDIFARGFDEE